MSPEEPYCMSPTGRHPPPKHRRLLSSRAGAQLKEKVYVPFVGTVASPSVEAVGTSKTAFYWDMLKDYIFHTL